MRLGLHRLGLAVVVAVATAPAARASILAEAVPARLTVDGSAGQLVTRDVVVANRGDDPLVVRVHLSDWAISERGEVSLRAAGTTPYSLADGVTFEPREFSLGPRASQSIRVQIRVPAAGAPTRSGVLLSEARSATAGPPSLGPRINAELGTTLYVTRVPPSAARPLLEDLRLEPIAGDTVRVRFRVRNTGLRHFYVSGRCALARMDGGELAADAVGTGVVLPGAVREFSWTTRAGLLPGRYLAVATLDTGSPELLIGERPFDWPPATAPPPVAHGSR